MPKKEPQENILAVSKPPIQSDLRKSPRLQFLDTGLFLQSAGLQKELIGIKDLHPVFKGKIIESYIRQELISIHSDTERALSAINQNSKNS